MADEQGRGPNPPWDPFGVWRQTVPAAAQVARPLAAQAGGLSMLGARTTLQVLVEAVKARLVGRRLSFGPPNRRVALTLTRVDVPGEPLLLAAGQIDRATLVAEDVEWAGHQFPRVRAELHNVHTRPGISPVLVTAPVELVVTVLGEHVAELVAQHAPRVAFEITDEASMRVRLRKHPSWGWVEVHPWAEGSRVLLRPTGVAARTRFWAFTKKIPPVHFGVELAEGMRIAGLTLEAGAIEVRLRVDAWRIDYLQALSFIKMPR